MPDPIAQGAPALSADKLNTMHAIKDGVSFTTKNGLTSATLTHKSGTSAEIYLHGAHIHSLQVAGIERLFMSDTCKYDGKSPLRGGIPLVGPVFGPSDEFGLHGFLRTTNWKVEKTSIDRDKDDAVTIKLVPNIHGAQRIHPAFKENVDFSLTVKLTKTGVALSLAVKNNGNADFEMKAAGFHTYFKTDPAATRIEGLPLEYFVSADPQSATVSREPAPYIVSATAETKHLYPNASDFTLNSPEGRISVRSNFHGTVIWRAGPEQEFPDLARADKGFVCGESIMFVPEKIRGGDTREFNTEIQFD